MDRKNALDGKLASGLTAVPAVEKESGRGHTGASKEKRQSIVPSVILMKYLLTEMNAAQMNAPCR